MYKKVDLEEGVAVQYVGVYVTNWRPEWGRPDVGFVEAESRPTTNATELAKRCEKCGVYRDPTGI